MIWHLGFSHQRHSDLSSLAMPCHVWHVIDLRGDNLRILKSWDLQVAMYGPTAYTVAWVGLFGGLGWVGFDN